MRPAGSAWNEVDTTMIRNCWHKAGILPDSACLPTITSPISVPVSMLVNTPTHVLDSIGSILQQSNRMDLKHLLNPIEEQNYMLVELSNQDICDVVLKAMAGKDTHADKRDDSDTEDEVAVRPQPTRSKTLEAISMIQSYVEDIDTPYARKVEDVLASFGRQTQLDGMKSAQETKIFDFFQKQ